MRFSNIPINHTRIEPSTKIIEGTELAAIKNVGEAAMAIAIRERDQRGEFSSLEEFGYAVDSRLANRKMLESLIKAGAFDFTGRDRAELFACIDESLNASAICATSLGQPDRFRFSMNKRTAATAVRRQPIKPWSEHEKLSYEKETARFLRQRPSARRICRRFCSKKISIDCLVRGTGRSRAIQNCRSDR